MLVTDAVATSSDRAGRAAARTRPLARASLRTLRTQGLPLDPSAQAWSWCSRDRGSEEPWWPDESIQIPGIREDLVEIAGMTVTSSKASATEPSLRRGPGHEARLGPRGQFSTLAPEDVRHPRRQARPRVRAFLIRSDR